MSKTKAQLIEELKQEKARNIALQVKVENYFKTNTELGVRIGQLESEMAELEAFKQDALKSLDKLSKEKEFLENAQTCNLARIDGLKSAIKTKDGIIEHQGGMLCERDALITGPLIRLMRERWERRTNR